MQIPDRINPIQTSNFLSNAAQTLFLVKYRLRILEFGFVQVPFNILCFAQALPLALPPIENKLSLFLKIPVIGISSLLVIYFDLSSEKNQRFNTIY
jgi:hypothetical protein